MSPLNTVPAMPAPTTSDTQKFRSQMGQISRHSAVFFAGTLFTAAAGYLFRVYLARVLGAEALGIYALGMTIIGFVGVFNGLGLPQSAVRFVASYSATGRYDELRGFVVRAVCILLAANVVLGLAVLRAGPWIAEHLYHTPQLNDYLALFALIMMLGALTTFFGQVLQGYKDVSRRTIITNFIGTPMMMVLTVVLVIWGKGLRGYILAQVFGALAILALLSFSVWRRTPSQARALSLKIPRLSGEIVSFSGAVYGIDFMKFLLAQSDKIFVGAYLSARDLGVYTVSAAIVTYVPIVLQSVNQIFSPTIAELHSSGQVLLLARLFRTLTKWILGLTLPLASVVVVFCQPLMRIFGQDFERGWPILIVGTIGQLISCGVGSVGYLLLMSGNERRLLRVQMFMSLLMLLMSVSLVPIFGIVGAAVASAITNAGINIWNLREVKIRLGLSPFSRSFLKLSIPTALMLAIVIVGRLLTLNTHAQWLVIMVICFLAYATFTLVALVEGLDPDDRLIAQAILSRGKSLMHPPRAENA